MDNKTENQDIVEYKQVASDIIKLYGGKKLNQLTNDEKRDLLNKYILARSILMRPSVQHSDKFPPLPILKKGSKTVGNPKKHQTTRHILSKTSDIESILQSDKRDVETKAPTKVPETKTKAQEIKDVFAESPEVKAPEIKAPTQGLEGGSPLAKIQEIKGQDSPVGLEKKSLPPSFIKQQAGEAGMFDLFEAMVENAGAQAVQGGIRIMKSFFDVVNETVTIVGLEALKLRDIYNYFIHGEASENMGDVLTQVSDTLKKKPELKEPALNQAVSLFKTQIPSDTEDDDEQHKKSEPSDPLKIDEKEAKELLNVVVQKIIKGYISSNDTKAFVNFLRRDLGIDGGEMNVFFNNMKKYKNVSREERVRTAITDTLLTETADGKNLVLGLSPTDEVTILSEYVTENWERLKGGDTLFPEEQEPDSPLVSKPSPPETKGEPEGMETKEEPEDPEEPSLPTQASPIPTRPDHKGNDTDEDEDEDPDVEEMEKAKSDIMNSSGNEFLKKRMEDIITDRIRETKIAKQEFNDNATVLETKDKYRRNKLRPEFRHFDPRRLNVYLTREHETLEDAELSLFTYVPEGETWENEKGYNPIYNDNKRQYAIRYGGNLYELPHDYEPAGNNLILSRVYEAPLPKPKPVIRESKQKQMSNRMVPQIQPVADLAPPRDSYRGHGFKSRDVYTEPLVSIPTVDNLMGIDPNQRARELYDDLRLLKSNSRLMFK